MKVSKCSKFSKVYILSQPDLSGPKAGLVRIKQFKGTIPAELVWAPSQTSPAHPEPTHVQLDLSVPLVGYSWGFIP
jgi:hypothetical protein